MRVIYRCSEGLSEVEVLEQSVIIHTDSGIVCADIMKDDGGDSYFIWKGETIYLQDWHSIRLDEIRGAGHAIEVIYTEAQKIIHGCNLFNAKFDIDGEIWTVTKLLHSDNSYKLLLAHGRDSREIHACDLLAKLKLGAIKQV